MMLPILKDHPLNTASELVKKSKVTLVKNKTEVHLVRSFNPTTQSDYWGVNNYPVIYAIGEKWETICFISALLLVGFVEGGADEHE